MSATTKIEWADATLNFWMGCQKVSEGCRNCYADCILSRYGDELWGPKAPRKFVKNTAAVLRQIQKAAKDPEFTSKSGGKRPMVFVNDFADTFEDYSGPVVLPDKDRLWVNEFGNLFTQPVLPSREISGKHATLDDLRPRIWQAVKENPNIIFQILTKRPENVMRMVPGNWRDGFPENIWLGTSVEDAKVLSRIDEMRRIPAQVRFLSCEPLLGPLNDINLGGIHWVIVGGESGENARPMHPDWARSLRDQCVQVGVPFFFKQWGEWHQRMRDGGWPDTRAGRCDYLPSIHLPESEGGPVVNMKRVGKKRAGRRLDGFEWNEFPSEAQK